MGNLIRPLVRLIIGMLAIPAFRFVLKRFVRIEQLDAELEKDLEQWFKCSLMLLASTQFMEPYLFGWLVGNSENMFKGETIDPILGGLRILVAIGAIELMPDQHLFSVVHPGPPRLRYDRTRRLWDQICENFKPVVRGLICQHINRTSPMFAILAAIIPVSSVSVFCYIVAIIQYLIIGLVTSRDRALDVLSEFDRQVAIRRQEIIEAYNLDDALKARDSRQAAQREMPQPAREDSDTATPRLPKETVALPETGIVAKADKPEYESH